ncbi:MAG: HlyD family efflux transporter periplasmic adaptor subunit [Chloroflexaceae bacterium]|nr:HlyD family efflux transporter periplasmic adaptor subunit [Chloroflexaceae bacterium]
MLAILDVRRFDHQVTRAEASLVIAKANQSALFEEPRAADIAVAEAQIRQAEAALKLAQAQKAALFESPRAADIEAANAQIRQAEASLAYLLSMPEEVDVRAAQAALELANVNLQATRDQLSHAKTQAEFQVKQAAYQLTQAQWNYALAQRYWEHAEDEGTDPLVPETVNALTGRSSDNDLSGGQEAQYRAHYEQAKAAMEQAEEAVRLSLVASEGARKSEVTGVQAGEQQVVQAQISLERVLDQPNEHQVAQAQAGLDLAIANRTRLNPDPTGAQIAQADAGIAQSLAAVDLAVASRDRLNPDPQESEQLRAEAYIIDADSALELAKLNREYAELRAPFGGTIAEINIDPGDPAMTSRDAAIKIVDVSNVYVSVDISDVDISKIDLDQPASVYADALPGKVFTGKVSYIAPTAKVEGNIRTYEVKITLDDTTGLKPGMSTRVEIETQE